MMWWIVAIIAIGAVSLALLLLLASLYVAGDADEQERQWDDDWRLR